MSASTEPLPDVMTTAVRGLARLSRTVERVLARDQLSLAQFRILDRLAAGSSHGKNLADWLAVKPPSITTLVDGLVKRGLVERNEDDVDRRQVTHTLTVDGSELHQQVSERLGELLSRILAYSHDKDSARAMVEALAAWDRALDVASEAKTAADKTVPQ